MKWLSFVGDKIKSGDAIILIESSGIHANGLTLARKIAEQLPEGYATKLHDGRMYGEALLTPTYIYANAISGLFKEDINIHYMIHITGHGFRKIMRAKENFTYSIETLPEVDELFKFIQEKSGMSDVDMYGTFNMGAGFTVILPEAEVDKALEIINSSGHKAIKAGIVVEGEKKVVIKPLNLTFKSESLNIR